MDTDDSGVTDQNSYTNGPGAASGMDVEGSDVFMDNGYRNDTGQQDIDSRTHEDIIIDDLKIDVEQLPVAYTERLEELQHVKDAMSEMMDGILVTNQNLEKNCEALEEKVSLDKEKLDRNERAQAQLNKEMAECRETWEARKSDAQRLNEEGIYLGLDMIRNTSGLTSSIIQKHLQIKNEDCVSNGINTMLFRSGEYKSQIASLKSQIAAFKAAIPQQETDIQVDEENDQNSA